MQVDRIKVASCFVAKRWWDLCGILDGNCREKACGPRRIEIDCGSRHYAPLESALIIPSLHLSFTGKWSSAVQVSGRKRRKNRSGFKVQ